MYRLVVVLMTLSLSGSEAAGPEPKWSMFLGDAQNQESGPLILEGTPLQMANELLTKEIKHPEFVVAKHYVHRYSDSEDPFSISLHQLFLRFLELRSIEEGLENDNIVCNGMEVSKLVIFETTMNKVLGGRLHKINMQKDSFTANKASEISKKYFTHCMAKLKQEFEKLPSDPELREAFDRMRVFESFIDEEKAAQRQGAPRYCNDEIQSFELVNYRKLFSKIGTEAGKIPAVVEDNVNVIEHHEAKKMFLELLRATCWHKELNGLGRSMRFIMEAKRSLLMNREWNFDCNENMGRFHLCNQASAKLNDFDEFLQI